MTSQQLRQKFLKFFEKNNHVIIPSASLVPSEGEQLAGKERVLFTSAGMQPLIPYLMGRPYPQGKRLADVQKCLRTDDIEEVGDAVHHTFFEMLGNWSLGDYWKDKAIRLSFEFLTKELEIPVRKLAVSVFAGDKDALRDKESAKVWQSLGISKDRIFYFGKEYNWWPTGEMLGPCGPDTEMFYWTGEGEPEGKPNENPLWVEIWNDVFMEFNRKEDGNLEELPQKNVDTGMGLERTLAVLNGKDNAYETDLFEPILKAIKIKDRATEVDDRIIADHFKAAIFLILDGVEPSNKMQGYVLRRLLRRSMVKLNKDLREFTILDTHIEAICDSILNIYDGIYGIDRHNDKSKILSIISEEFSRFGQNLNIGLSKIEKIHRIDSKIAFDLYQSYGFPLEITEELFKEKGQEINHQQFEEEFKKHQQISRSTQAGTFKGGLAGHSETEIKYHTATHLLHQALRDVLGPEVFQKGSNITSERLRFDFSFDRKMTEEEIKQVEDIVNKKIKENLKVDQMTLDLEKAKLMNAIGLFDEKYTDKVSLYGVGPGYQLDPKAKDQRNRGGYYSLEFCGGPHVEHTGVIGKIKITKEEAISSGIRRIRAQITI